MEEPEVIQKPEEIHPLSKEISHLIDTYIGSIEDAKKPSTPIHIDEIASRIAKFYEMIRKVIDWKEDSVLRRSAIERALKRTLFTKLVTAFLSSLSTSQSISISASVIKFIDAEPTKVTLLKYLLAT